MVFESMDDGMTNVRNELNIVLKDKSTDENWH